MLIPLPVPSSRSNMHAERKLSLTAMSQTSGINFLTLSPLLIHCMNFVILQVAWSPESTVSKKQVTNIWQQVYWSIILLQEYLHTVSHSRVMILQLLLVRLLQSLQEKQHIDLIAIITTWDAPSHVNVWYAILFITIGFDKILPASGWISS